MKKILHLLQIIIISFTYNLWAQQQVNATVEIIDLKSDLKINQTIIYKNTTNKALKSIILNDWNNAFSNKNSALGEKLADEFVRNFHFATKQDLGQTIIYSVTDKQNNNLKYNRLKTSVDHLEIHLNSELNPGESTTISLNYSLQLPSSKFTRYGKTNNNEFQIKDWLLLPSQIKNEEFIIYSNLNLNDSSSEFCDITINIKTKEDLKVKSNLFSKKTDLNQFELKGNKLNQVQLYVTKNQNTRVYINQSLEVETDMISNNLDDFSTAIIINQIVDFVSEKLPNPKHKKILVTNTDYNNNPIYGLNQLPNFLRPFEDEFLFELKFLKTFIENYTRDNLTIDFRKDNWIKNAIETKLILDYLDIYHPNQKMLGKISNLKILKSFYATDMEMKDQMKFLYLMMARRNLDQPTGASKDDLIKFNEQIASKYKAGLDLIYLNSYLGNNIIESSIKEYFKLNQTKITSENDFRKIIESKTDKNLNWFFESLLKNRSIIDYKIKSISRKSDSLNIKIKNKGDVDSPISVFTISDNIITNKFWVNGFKNDSTITILNNDYDKIILNYDGEIPEYNQKNNHKKTKSFSIFNKPVNFTLFKDFENPNTSQLFFVPEFRYNLYDGLMPGISLSNKSTLRQPFTYDLSPFYSPNQKTLVGTAFLNYEHLNRRENPYSINYNLLTNYYHYVQDAAYFRVIPSILINFRDPDFRKNHLQSLQFRFVKVSKEHSNFVPNLEQDNYSVFNARFSAQKNKINNFINLLTDIQISNKFGKISAETQYRKLYSNNRQFNFRFFVGTFLFRDTKTNYFDFATNKPTDYLFDSNFYGRSEDSGFFSQQFINKEGGFKSKVTPFSNQWMATTNLSTNIWNWIEVYSDLGLIKSKNYSPEFIYDSGIRLNLVTDFFEVYFPVHSNLGWEITQSNYQEKIRFIITFDINKLSKLVTRRWF